MNLRKWRRVVLQGESSAVIRRRSRRDVGQINTANVHSQSSDSKRIGTHGNRAAEKEEKDQTTSVGRRRGGPHQTLEARDCVMQEWLWVPLREPC